MQLEDKKIYKVGLYAGNAVMPSLLYTGTAKVYVSLEKAQPAAISDMIEVTSELTQGVNVLQGQIRWIAADYQAQTDIVKECGILSAITRSLVE